jgi:hypothetical protein
MVVLTWRYQHELLGHEDGVQGQRGSTNCSERYVNRSSQDRVKQTHGGHLRHGDMACATESLITTQKLSKDRQHYYVDIQAVLGKYDRVFGRLPAGRPPDREF